ncbi:hypothetical protein M8C21_021340 [Ambrosia artemisiifolia]|uniref:Uncharacterized protein n=1 Tax=Ambrosia artemisiifolia TaxID=4212 RepID=A0AAD5C3K9_AMBAR|nr:hypothetical protein M8C21_021340 [Ambrosia artemisiifolia]
MAPAIQSSLWTTMIPARYTCRRASASKQVDEFATKGVNHPRARGFKQVVGVEDYARRIGQNGRA